MNRKNGLLLKVLLFVALPGILLSHTVNVVRPFTGDSLCRCIPEGYNSYHTISWGINNSTDDTHNIHVRLLLYDASGTTLIQTIDPDTNGSLGEGIYEGTWNVNTVAPGSYRVRVQTLDDNSFADSGVFTISDCHYIKVSKPFPGSVLDVGSNIGVWWNLCGITPPSLKILLYNEQKTQIVWTISNAVSTNLWAHQAVIPNSVLPGNYVVRVSNQDDSVYDDSEVFTINDYAVFKPMEIPRAIQKFRILPYWRREISPRVKLRGGLYTIVFNISQLQQILKKYRTNHPISLELQKGGMPPVKLGTFAPELYKSKREKAVAVLSLPAQLKLKVKSKRLGNRIKPGSGYFLVVKDRAGKVLAKTRITLKDQTGRKFRVKTGKK